MMKGESNSVRWTGKISVPQTGKYDLSFGGKDGFRVWINGKKIIDQWNGIWFNSGSGTLVLDSGMKYDIRIEHCQHFRGSMARLEWGQWSRDDVNTIVNEALKCDAIVFVGGISPILEGEENNIDAPGFFKGDRIKIDLPEIQINILKQLKEKGKPVILVLMNGSAIALNWEDKNLDAIVEAWYPGQEGGTAIADVLFGDYNPSGRLPVTFYKSTDQLPPFDEYSMKGRTYRYFEGEPLYPFGYGLSYSNFKYSNLQVPQAIKTIDTVSVSVDVENTGKYDGNEVVQLYIKHINAKVRVPLLALEGFKRIYLKAGEKKTVIFTLDPAKFSIIDNTNHRKVVPGAIEIFAGGCQPSAKLIASEKIIKTKTEIKGKEFIVE
jgi:beta-glucosidase